MLHGFDCHSVFALILSYILQAIGLIAQVYNYFKLLAFRYEKLDIHHILECIQYTFNHSIHHNQSYNQAIVSE